MTETALWSAWALWMAVAALVIVVAAALLVTILLTARSIRSHAHRALRAAEVIQQRTQPIWQLQTTNETAADLLATVQSLEAKGGALTAALEGHTHGAAKR